MSDAHERPRRKVNKNTHITKSGKAIKLNRSLGDRIRASREARAQRRAAYLSSLPKEPWKRLLHRIHPKRLYQYWFSRDGAVMALKLMGVGLVVVFLIVVGLFAYFRKDLPSVKDINTADSGGSIPYYDRTGKELLFQDYDAFKRIPVDGTKISKYMKEATIALEDKDFYHEGAFNIKGITRAAVNNATGGSTQGGSTITQQLVKLNEGWSQERTISNKVKELILAVELEREYSKDDILNAYLNLAPYNGLDYGVEAAAKDYFGVHASELTLAQSTMLAAIPKSPSSLSPYASPDHNPYAEIDRFDKEGLLYRQHYALKLMVQQGYVTQAEADKASKEDILGQIHDRPTSHYKDIRYPYFVLAAKAELEKTLTTPVVRAGGLKVITTLDIGLQDLAEKSLNDNLHLLKKYKADNAAFVAEDNETGQVMALIGGVDFDIDSKCQQDCYSKLNFATERNISPGSSVKPYDYATFINNNTNVGAGSMLYDDRNALPVTSYECTNKALPEDGGNCLHDYDRVFPGPVTLRYALGGSRNVPAVKAMISSVPGDTSKDRMVSVEKVRSTASALMGVEHGYRCYKYVEDFFNVTEKDIVPCTASSGIGDGAYLYLKDHVNGIASLARMGKVVPQTMLLKVTNTSGKVLKEFEQPKPKKVIEPDSAYIVNDMAADPKASYLSGVDKFHRYKGWTNSIKTGTTNNMFDGLMVSWNPKYSAGIWVGNHNRTTAFEKSPEYMTAPIMRQFMQGAINQLGDVKPQTWVAPPGIKTASAFVGKPPYKTQAAPSTNTDIYPSWYVGKSGGSSAAIDKVSGKLANSCTPTLARQDDSGGNVSTWNVDILKGGHPSGGSNSTSTSHANEDDDVHVCGEAQPEVSITAVGDTSASGHAKLNCLAAGCLIMVHVEQGAHAFTDSQYPDFPGTLSLLVNGQTVQTQAVTGTGAHDYQLVYKPAAGISGEIQLQALVTDSVLYSDTDTVTVNVGS